MTRLDNLNGQGDPSGPGDPSDRDAAQRLALARVRTELARERNSMADERTDLSRERTTLSWLRTSLSLLGFGLVVEKFQLAFPASGVGHGKIVVAGLYLMASGLGAWATVSRLRELQRSWRRGRGAEAVGVLALSVSSVAGAWLAMDWLSR